MKLPSFFNTLPMELKLSIMTLSDKIFPIGIGNVLNENNEEGTAVLFCCDGQYIMIVRKGKWYNSNLSQKKQVEEIIDNANTIICIDKNTDILALWGDAIAEYERRENEKEP